MKRNFPSFLDAYLDYARDGFCPDSYHIWTALSIISGALERKVWLPEDMIVHYPNTFVLLVGHPGVGKSTAIKRGIALIRRLRAEHNQDFKVMSGVMTQAGLCSEMNVLSTFNLDKTTVQFSSGYYYAGEASESGLQNLHGDFNATVTALYDCEDSYEKTLKNEAYRIPHPSLCILSGSTFDFLKGLVNQNSVMGGLASRFIYVISEERKLSDPVWVTPRKGDAPGKRETEELLLQDLVAINKMAGSFVFEKPVFDIFTAWWNQHKENYLGLASEKMESILARKPTALKKTVMLLSASERNDRVITGDHMKRAIQLVDEVTKDNAVILSSAIIGNKNTQESINHFLLRTVEKAGGVIKVKDLKRAYVTYGGDPSKYEGTVNLMYQSGIFSAAPDDAGSIKLLVDPNRHL